MRSTKKERKKIRICHPRHCFVSHVQSSAVWLLHKTFTIGKSLVRSWQTCRSTISTGHSLLVKSLLGSLPEAEVHAKDPQYTFSTSTREKLDESSTVLAVTPICMLLHQLSIKSRMAQFTLELTSLLTNFPTQRWYAFISIQWFIGSHFNTCMIIVIIYKFNQWQVYVPFSLWNR